MAAVEHRAPAARPLLPTGVITESRLSDAQLESVVLAAEAHSRDLPGLYQIDSELDSLHPADPRGDARTEGAEGAEGAVTWSAPTKVRAGWMLGDGTGTGKGRQVAGIILDRWLRGSRMALWLSASDKLVEDAQRDWTALGGDQNDVAPVNAWRQKDPINRETGILFTTYATLRSPARNGNPSRLQQIIGWLAGTNDEAGRRRWDGVVVFDEAHAMANAAGGKGARGAIAPSQQGRAGVRLQNALPQARILYVSATGASTIDGLGYATRLGLWGTPETPFSNRNEFVQAMNAGGVAALEVVARDLKALGRYQARALSYSGVEVDILEHTLTGEQRTIYDSYTEAFKIIHHHLAEALEATRIETAGGTDAQAKAAARSAFESAKQRFFGHLLTSMKCPTLLRAMEQNIAAGHAPVVQIVSTGEALTERRIAQAPTSEWDDLNIDLTPREYVMDYLSHAFPVHLRQQYQDEDGNIHTKEVTDGDGNPVLSQEAVRLRDELIEHLGALPAVGTALDQILHHFGHEQVAEISGRSRRVLRIDNDGGGGRLALRRRPATANLHETRAFMDGRKPILIFSMAGNTGRSYHADVDCGNTKRRRHYLLEAGWRANQAIQGLGRTHRTRQTSPPVFRPVTTDVKGERRFISTIARRMHSLGAITRGQKGSQNAMGDDNAALFREQDNFESPYAAAALRTFYRDLSATNVPGWPAARFEDATGLHLTDSEGMPLQNPPPMSTFLNRLLALPIAEQNELFEHLEGLVEANIEDAVENGTLNQGVERIAAASLEIVSSECAADTNLIEIRRRDRLTPTTLGAVLAIHHDELARGRNPQLLLNRHSTHAALCTRAPARTLEDGTVEQRRRLIQPGGRRTVPMSQLKGPQSGWQPTDREQWDRAWNAQCDAMPKFRESRFWLVTGILLPIWNRLPETDVRVYRLTTDDGRNLIGRVLSAGEVETVRTALGLDAAQGPTLTAGERMAELTRRRCRYLLDGDLVLAGRRHMGLMRVEVEHGHSEAHRRQLKGIGCQTEIVQYRTRLFVPDPETMERLLARYPIRQRYTTADGPRDHHA